MPTSSPGGCLGRYYADKAELYGGCSLDFSVSISTSNPTSISQICNLSASSSGPSPDSKLLTSLGPCCQRNHNNETVAKTSPHWRWAEREEGRSYWVTGKMMREAKKKKISSCKRNCQHSLTAPMRSLSCCISASVDPFIISKPA